MRTRQPAGRVDEMQVSVGSVRAGADELRVANRDGAKYG